MGSRFQSGITRGWRGEVPGDRRRSCRYLALHSESQIGWWKDSTFEEKPAKLIDISLHGGLLTTKSKPPVAVGKPIWYRPVGVPNNEWIEGLVVKVTKPLLGQCRLAIRFTTDFRYETFKAIVYGAPVEEPTSHREIPEHEMHHFWK